MERPAGARFSVSNFYDFSLSQPCNSCRLHSDSLIISVCPWGSSPILPPQMGLLAQGLHFYSLYDSEINSRLSTVPHISFALLRHSQPLIINLCFRSLYDTFYLFCMVKAPAGAGLPHSLLCFLLTPLGKKLSLVHMMDLEKEISNFRYLRAQAYLTHRSKGFLEKNVFSRVLWAFGIANSAK